MHVKEQDCLVFVSEESWVPMRIVIYDSFFMMGYPSNKAYTEFRSIALDDTSEKNDIEAFKKYMTEDYNQFLARYPALLDTNIKEELIVFPLKMLPCIKDLKL